MANSSDWTAELAAPAAERPAAAPTWVAALGARRGFRPNLPFGGPASPGDDPAAPDGEQAKAAALAQAFADGEAAGRSAAQEEARVEGEHQRALRLAFRAFDQAAMDALAADLVETVITLCSAAIADFTPDTESLERRCAEAARRLGSAAEDCTLRLNPVDSETLREKPLEGWQIAPDPAVERGGLVLEGPDGSVHDGPAEWRRAIEAAVRG
jgi:flagellar assembly protein FliH